MRDLADTIRRFSALPGPDLHDLLRALIANVCLGNGDAHGKNFALLHTPDGVRLSPFYDIVSTEIYPMRENSTRCCRQRVHSWAVNPTH